MRVSVIWDCEEYDDWAEEDYRPVLPEEVEISPGIPVERVADILSSEYGSPVLSWKRIPFYGVTCCSSCRLDCVACEDEKAMRGTDLDHCCDLEASSGCDCSCHKEGVL